MSVLFENDELTVIFCDENGKFQNFENFWQICKPNSEEFKDDSYNTERDLLINKIKEYLPKFIVVCADNPECKRIKQFMENLKDDLMKDSIEILAVVFGDSIINQLFKLFIK